MGDEKERAAERAAAVMFRGEKHGTWPSTVAVFNDRYRFLGRLLADADLLKVPAEDLPSDDPACRYCGTDCSNGRSWDGGTLYACGPCSDARAAGNRRQATTPTKLDNPPAVGAPKNWPWGYLTCGCCNDGFGRHVRNGAGAVSDG